MIFACVDMNLRFGWSSNCKIWKIIQAFFSGNIADFWKKTKVSQTLFFLQKSLSRANKFVTNSKSCKLQKELWIFDIHFGFDFEKNLQLICRFRKCNRHRRQDIPILLLLELNEKIMFIVRTGPRIRAFVINRAKQQRLYLISVVSAMMFKFHNDRPFSITFLRT